MRHPSHKACCPARNGRGNCGFLHYVRQPLRAVQNQAARPDEKPQGDRNSTVPFIFAHHSCSEMPGSVASSGSFGVGREMRQLTDQTGEWHATCQGRQTGKEFIRNATDQSGGWAEASFRAQIPQRVYRGAGAPAPRRHATGSLGKNCTRPKVAAEPRRL